MPSTSPHTSGFCIARFDALTPFVHQSYLWAPRPFILHTLPWEDDHPELASWLRSLDVSACRALEADPFADPDAPSVWRRWARERQRLVEIQPVPTANVAHLDNHHVRFRIPGRKWTQVRAFAAALAAAHTRAPRPNPTRLVEWCAGHGHLGRTLGYHTGLPAVLIERQTDMATPAEHLASRLRTSVRFIVGDVLRPSAWEYLQPDTIAIGLHACGALNASLLREGVGREVRLLMVVPCCPHVLGDAERFVPMSERGRAANLELDNQALRLSIADESVATAGEVKRRQRECAWRQGLDLLVREATGEDHYHSLGVLPTGALRVDFATFCRVQAERCGLALPAQWDPQKMEDAGWERARLARALGLVRSLFRRPLDLWLVLDRALFLVEQGRAVQVGTFCSSAQTPRNVMIISHIQAGR